MAGLENVKRSIFSYMFEWFSKGKCDNLSDQTADSKIEEFIQSWVQIKCKGYSGAAEYLGITPNNLRQLISRYDVQGTSICGNKEKILFPSQIEKLRLIICDKTKR